MPFHERDTLPIINLKIYGKLGIDDATDNVYHVFIYDPLNQETKPYNIGDVLTKVNLTIRNPSARAKPSFGKKKMTSHHRKLNQYLEQMLDCARAVDRAKFGRINSEYISLLDKTFPKRIPAYTEYDHARNKIATALMLAERKEKPLAEIRERCLSQVEEFLQQQKP